MDIKTKDDDENINKVNRWLSEISGYKRKFNEWFCRAEFILDEYTNKKQKIGKNAINHTFNILWANVQTMMPALYAKMPNPEISRRFKDRDAVGRVASDLLERCARFNIDECNLDEYFRDIVLDYLLIGRGVLWARYDYTEKGIGEYSKNEEGEEYEVKDLECEKVYFDYIDYEDFGHSYAKKWEHVDTVWRSVYMSKDDAIDRFGKDKIEGIVFNSSDSYNNDIDDKSKEGNKYCIYEVWHKPSKKVYWLTKGCDVFLDEKEDFLKLNNFFPCPKPLYATTTNNSLEPIPDYILYRSQIQQLNILTSRITKLIKNVRVIGTYDSSSPAIKSMFDNVGEDILIPVTNWAAFSGKGGVKGAVDIMPVADFANCIKILYDSFIQQKEQAYEITGISDLLRGQTAASETATAQDIKSNFASMRFQDRRAQVSKFIRDCIEIMTEIISNKFDVKTLKLMSNLKLCENQEEKQQIQQAIQQGAQLDETYIRMVDEPTWEEVIKFIRDDKLRTFRIDIETDSTVRADEAKEKAEALEFTRVMGAFIREALPAGQANPQLAPLLGEMFVFLGNKFRSAKSMVGQMEKLVEDWDKEAKTPKPQPPNPEVLKIQLEEKKLQLDQQKFQTQLQFDMQIKDKELQNAMMLDQAQGQREMQIKQLDAELKSRVEASAQQQQTLDTMRTSEIEREKDTEIAALNAQIETLKQDNENLRHQDKEINTNYREELKSQTQKEIALINVNNKAKNEHP